VFLWHRPHGVAPEFEDARPTPERDFRMNDVIDARQELFNRNVEAFRENYLVGYQIITSITAPHSRVVFDDNGEPDIEFQGTRLYGKGAHTYSEELVRNELAQPRRLTIHPPSSKSLDAYGADYLVRMLDRAVKAEIGFTLDPDADQCYHLICFGIGLGVHLKSLIEKSPCRSLILIEPNYEFLYHSCFFTDWAAIFAHFRQPGRHITFCVSNNHLKIAVEVRNAVRTRNVCAFDGTMMFRLYTSSIMDRANQKMREDGNLFLAGLGFATDEVQMITNTFMNLKSGKALIYRKGLGLRQDFPVFIVGSGPSIDGSLEVIRRNQDNAIIISLGTALTVLVRNGIFPDFHVELENVEAVYDVLSKFAKVGDFRRVCLIATTTVSPRVPTLFDETVFFFRPGLSSFPIFSLGHAHTVNECGPLVCNLGFSFAQEMGFQNVYFFGVDLGARRPDVHHSRFAPYLESEETKYMDGDLAAWEGDFNQWVPGNFGGKAATGFHHLWARDVIERLIVFNRAGRNYYNCSDGVRINGTIPRRPSTVSLPSRGDKKQAIRRMLDSYITYTPEHFRHAWDEQNWEEKLADYGNQLLKVCEAAKDDPTNLYLDTMIGMFVSEVYPPAEVLFFRGSMMMVMGATYYYAARVSPRERRPEFNRIVREEIMETIRKLSTLGTELVGQLNASR